MDARVYQRRWWTLGVLCLSLMVVVLDNTILNVALPTLGRDMEASTRQLQWIVDAYTLVFAGLLLFAGSLGDRLGRRRALTGGLIVFLGGSLLATMSGSPMQLIACRALMGVGGAFIMPATLSVLINVFTDARERAKAIAIWAGVSALGIAIGPTAGGWLLEHFSWHSVFMVNVPIVLVALGVGRFLVPESRDPSVSRLDVIGAVLSVTALVSLVYAIIEAPTHGWLAPTSLVWFGGAALLLGLFVAWELHTDEPMLDVRFFGNARFTAASLSITMVFFALFGALFFLTQYLQFVLGYTAFQAGLRMIPVAVSVMVAAPLSAKLVDRIGTKIVVASGLTVCAGGLLLASTATVGSSYGLIGTAMALIGVGMGLTMAPATESIMGSLPREKAGVGSAMNDTTREVGGALGVAVLGSLLTSSYGPAMDGTIETLHLSGPDGSAVREGVAGAATVSTRLGGDAGHTLFSAAQSAFTDAMQSAFAVGAGVALTGALVALAFLPSRAPEADEAGDAATDADDGLMGVESDALEPAA